MTLHILFCLDEIDCEIAAIDAVRLPETERLTLERYTASMRTMLAGLAAQKATVDRVISFDDLFLIRGIDKATTNVLATKGVTGFSTIANCKQADIATLSDERLSLERIARENWIEQAAILETGALTNYSERLRRDEFSSPVAISSPDAALALICDEKTADAPLKTEIVRNRI